VLSRDGQKRRAFIHPNSARRGSSEVNQGLTTAWLVRGLNCSGAMGAAANKAETYLTLIRTTEKGTVGG
jgi:hypothetical protein